jgi:hypothetical protein
MRERPSATAAHADKSIRVRGMPDLNVFQQSLLEMALLHDVKDEEDHSVYLN